MRRPPGTKPVAVFGKCPVPFALQYLHHRLLDQSIQHRRNTKLSYSPVRLRDLYPFYRLRFIGSTQQLFPDDWPMLFQVLRQLLDGHPVHAGAPFVGLDSCQCLLAVFPLADFFHQLFANGRAFCPALRRERFGPFTEAIRASPLHSSTKASNIWFFCRLSLMSRTAYLPLPSTLAGTVRAFSTSVPITPSADFCRPVRIGYPILSPVSGPTTDLPR